MGLKIPDAILRGVFCARPLPARPAAAIPATKERRVTGVGMSASPVQDLIAGNPSLLPLLADWQPMACCAILFHGNQATVTEIF